MIDCYDSIYCIEDCEKCPIMNIDESKEKEIEKYILNFVNNFNGGKG